MEPTLFLGKHPSTLDRKSRFAAPPVYQHELAGGAYVLQGFERNLLVLPPQAFETMYRTVTTQNLADPLVRSLLRMLLGSAQEVSLDKSSRLALPEDLKEFAQLEGDVLLVGQGDFFEVWQPDLWEEQEDQLRDAVTNSSRFSTLNITTR
jgi:MraZ protein